MLEIWAGGATHVKHAFYLWAASALCIFILTLATCSLILLTLYADFGLFSFGSLSSWCPPNLLLFHLKTSLWVLPLIILVSGTHFYSDGLIELAISQMLQSTELWAGEVALINKGLAVLAWGSAQMQMGVSCPPPSSLPPPRPPPLSCSFMFLGVVPL